MLVTFATLGGFWAPAMALLSDASEAAGLDLALAFSISNLAWALGHLVGSGGGGALADATSDAVPYGLLGLACALTLVGSSRWDERPRALSRSALTSPGLTGSSARARCRRGGTASARAGPARPRRRWRGRPCRPARARSRG